MSLRLLEVLNSLGLRSLHLPCPPSWCAPAYLPRLAHLPQWSREELRPVHGEAGQADSKTAFPQHGQRHTQGLQIWAQTGESGVCQEAPRGQMASQGLGDTRFSHQSQAGLTRSQARREHGAE
jgi:hypothetical protein